MRSAPVFPVALVMTATLAFPMPALATSREDVLITWGFFVCVAVVAALVTMSYMRGLNQRHQTLRTMVEKGMEIPPSLLGPGLRPSNPSTDVRRGILLVSAGLGIGLFLLAESGREEAMIGLIPALIGVGYLVVSRIEKTRQAHQPPETDQPALT